jgi:hypothetical protein
MIRTFGLLLVSTAAFAQPTILFGGRNLDAWVYNPSVWSIHGDAIRGTGQAGQMFTRADYGSFRLMVTSRVVLPEFNTASAHLGILFWGDRPAPGTWGPAGALQIQPPHGAMWNYQTNQAVTPIRVIPRQEIPFQYHDWHTAEIVANLKTATVRMAIDRVEIVRYTDPKPAAWRAGPIGLQLHLGTAVMEYKDIQVEADPKEDRLITLK